MCYSLYSFYPASPTGRGRRLKICPVGGSNPLRGTIWGYDAIGRRDRLKPGFM